MAVFNNILAGASGQTGGAAAVDYKSLRFNSADSASLTRTPASAGNLQTWTWSAWVKKAQATITADNVLFGYYLNSSPFPAHYLRFENANNSALRFEYPGGSANLITSQVFRDPSAWYHIVAVWDTTNATADDRHRLYVNGVQVTDFSARSNPAQNTNGLINSVVEHGIGRFGQTASNYFNGYLADVNFVDGLALTPGNFAETDATTGQWVPKEYSGTYGTNGFRLGFSDSSNTTTIAEDSSGNGNNWTANNISVTAGAGNDSLFDSPTNGDPSVDTGLGGEVRGNYATLNPLSIGNGQGVTLSNGNLDYLSTAAGGQYATRFLTIGTSTGKWYVEFSVAAVGNGGFIGITNDPNSINNYIGQNASSWGYLGNATKWTSGSSTSYGASWTGGDVISLALDLDSGTLTFYKNGTSQGTAYSSLPAGTYFIGISGTTNFDAKINAGQRAFAYTAPSGFKALCTTNLTDPTITDPSDYMDVALWTGNGTSQTISGLGFSPDLVWPKCRSNTGTPHYINDAVRGAGKTLFSDSTLAETTYTNYLTAFTSDGFSLGNGGDLNGSSRTFVGWCWDAGSSTVSNTDGSITSSVRANASAGFSIVGYTGTGSNATVGHGLGVAPEFGIVKMRTDAGFDWCVYHSGLPSAAYALALHSTGAQDNNPPTWNSTAPTSSVFSIGTRGSVNTSSKNFIAYWWTPVEGYSAFGSYTGNGSSDGPFVYTGFRPRWLLIKNYTAGSNEYWILIDAARSPSNVAANFLYPNDSIAEGTLYFDTDLLSNGFKLRNTVTGTNLSSHTYAWAAFAEHPFKYARAR